MAASKDFLKSIGILNRNATIREHYLKWATENGLDAEYFNKKRQIPTKECPCCGIEFRKSTITCSHRCGNIYFSKKISDSKANKVKFVSCSNCNMTIEVKLQTSPSFFYCDVCKLDVFLKKPKKKFRYRYELGDDKIISVSNDSITMRDASHKLNIPYTTFIRVAKELDCYNPKQGFNENKSGYKVDTNEYLENKRFIGTVHLKERLFNQNMKQNKCEICGTEGVWMNKPIALHLHHIDGNKRNNNLSNLQILCPNCHTQTDTYGSKKRKEIENI